FLYHYNFFSCAIDKMELNFREKYGKRNTWKSPSRPEVHNLSTRNERCKCSYGKGMENMPGIQVVDVFSGYDIDFTIPVSVQFVELAELIDLLVRKVGEIPLNEF